MIPSLQPLHPLSCCGGGISLGADGLGCCCFPLPEGGYEIRGGWAYETLVLTKPGLYRLTSDICSNAFNTPAIQVASSGVILDLNGYRLVRNPLFQQQQEQQLLGSSCYGTGVPTTTLSANLISRDDVGVLIKQVLVPANSTPTELMNHVEVCNGTIRGFTKAAVFAETFGSGLTFSNLVLLQTGNLSATLDPITAYTAAIWCRVASQILFRNVCIRHVKAPTGFAAGILLQTCTNVGLDQVHIRDILNLGGPGAGVYTEQKCVQLSVSNATTERVLTGDQQIGVRIDHTATGFYIRDTTQTVMDKCTASYIFGSVDDAHAFPVFQSSGLVMTNCVACQVRSGFASPMKTGAKCTGFEIFLTGNGYLRDCTARFIGAHNPENKLCAGFDVGANANVQFENCVSTDNFVVLTNNEGAGPAPTPVANGTPADVGATIVNDPCDNCIKLCNIDSSLTFGQPVSLPFCTTLQCLLPTNVPNKKKKKAQGKGTLCDPNDLPGHAFLVPPCQTTCLLCCGSLTEDDKEARLYEAQFYNLFALPSQCQLESQLSAQIRRQTFAYGFGFADDPRVPNLRVADQKAITTADNIRFINCCAERNDVGFTLFSHVDSILTQCKAINNRAFGIFTSAAISIVCRAATECLSCPDQTDLACFSAGQYILVNSGRNNIVRETCIAGNVFGNIVDLVPNTTNTYLLALPCCRAEIPTTTKAKKSRRKSVRDTSKGRCCQQ